MIQYSDANHGPGSYKHLATDQLLVTDIWFTIQGEGPQSGIPAVFIRLAGCNRGDKLTMGCAFCDTDFSFAKGKAMSFQQIRDTMREVAPVFADKLTLVVITGGEPMMQDNLSAFLDHLRRNGWDRIAIESNGDRLSRGYAQNADEGITLVISPKANKSGYKAPDINILYHAKALKFLIKGEVGPYFDVPQEYVNLWVMRLGKPVSEIYLSPVNEYAREVLPGETASIWDTTLIDMRRTRSNYRRAALLAKERGYRISLQTHLLLDVS